MNGSAADAHAAALQQQHVQAAAARVQQQPQGMSLPMATSEPHSSNNNKPRQPGLPPTPPQRAADVGMVDVDPGMPPRKAHRRSSSDVPFGYFVPGMGMGMGMGVGGGHQLLPQPKMEAACWGGGHADSDDLFCSYLNLDGMDGLNHSSADERHEDGDSRGSSMKTNGADSSENESEEGGADSRAAGILLWADRREGLKRGAAGEPPIAPRHARSLSMDSIMGNGKFNVSAGGVGTTSVFGAPNVVNMMPGPNRFSLEFGSGEFTPAEMKKIMADEKLAEMALVDPKRVKRVLANRQSAARSKERKMRYIAELEQKVQILQTEATTLSAQLTLLQRDSAGIATENNELKFRLQAMEQQAQLRDALNDALTAEVQRLKLATADLGDSCSSDNLAQQMQINVQDQMFQLQQQQEATPIPFYQRQQTQQQSEAAKNHESKE